MKLLEGRCGLILGVANERSLAWGIAQAAHEQGARLVLTYQSERLARRVKPLAEQVGAELVLPCDLTQAEDLAGLRAEVGRHWTELDFLVHSVAFARREDLEGRFLDTSREGFLEAMDVSVLSLVELARVFEDLPGRSRQDPNILTLTYLASQRAMPGYNVMGVAKAALESSVRYLAADLGPGGVRVNALSAGPVKTLSAAGVKGLRTMLNHVAGASPLRRNVSAADVGQAALFPLSSLGRGMTGEVFYVDAGYHAMGVAPGLAPPSGPV